MFSKMKKVRNWWFPNSEEHLTKAVDTPNWLNRGFDYQTQQRDYSLHLATKYISRSRRAIDIGAHVGLWSVDLCNYFSKVECFEPVEIFRDCLSNNLKDNKIPVDIYAIHPYALGSEQGTVKMLIDKNNTGNSRISVDKHEKTSGGHFEMVERKTLDSFKFQGVDYIKIDCEGHELPIVHGAQRTIQINRPIIVVENKPGKIGYSHFVTLKHLLYQWGYIIDHWIKSEVIFVHKHNIKRDWDKGKKTQRIEDGLFESLNTDYSYYDNYDKIITTGPQVLSDGVASNTSVETHIDLTSLKHYKLDDNKDNNDLE